MTMQVEYGVQLYGTSLGRCSFWAPKQLHYCTDYNFLCEEKEHVMTPHNSNKTSWVIFGPYIILQV